MMISSKETLSSTFFFYEHSKRIATLLALIECVVIAAIGLGIHFKIPMAYYCAAPLAGLDILFLIALYKKNKKATKFILLESKKPILEKANKLNLTKLLKKTQCYLGCITINAHEQITQLYFIFLNNDEFYPFKNVISAQSYIKRKGYIEIKEVKTLDDQIVFLPKKNLIDFYNKAKELKNGKNLFEKLKDIQGKEVSLEAHKQHDTTYFSYLSSPK